MEVPARLRRLGVTTLVGATVVAAFLAAVFQTVYRRLTGREPRDVRGRTPVERLQRYARRRRSIHVERTED